MNTPRSIKRRGLRLAPLLGLLALLLVVLARPAAALAHPLDVYLQASYITIAPAQMVVELDLSPGVLVAPQALKELDTNNDGQISDAEGQVYSASILRNVTLQVDGKPLLLEMTKIEMPSYLALQAGYGTIRVFTHTALADGLTGTHQIAYTNANASTGVTYQVNAFVDKGVAITLGKQNRDSTQQTLTVDYAISGATLATPLPSTAATTPATAGAAGTASASEQVGQLLGYLQAPSLSPWVLLVALALAALLGGLHALTPGHGKTLVAAYLVGSRGTVRDAIVLGATVTLTHTASVLVFGALALVASQAVAATLLAALLELCAALLVVGLGARLLWARWRALGAGAAASSHGHPHPLPGGTTRTRGLIGLGMAGGALPCPEAMAILLVAVGIGRIGLGLGLIVSFSLGLAVVLIAIGVLLVRAESRLKRFAHAGDAWGRWLPLASAVVVTTLGIAMLVGVLGRAALPPTVVLALVGAMGVFASGYGLALVRARRRARACQLHPRPPPGCRRATTPTIRSARRQWAQPRSRSTQGARWPGTRSGPISATLPWLAVRRTARRCWKRRLQTRCGPTLKVTNACRQNWRAGSAW